MDTSKELNYKLYIQKEEGFVRTDIKSEFSRYDDIKLGNVDKVKSNFKEIRKDYYKGKGILSTNPVRNNIYHLVVSAGIIARVCVDEGMPHDEAYTLSDIYIRRADIAKTPEEVIDLIEQMQIDFATRMKDHRKSNAYSIHIRHAIDYIYDHLNGPLTMKQLADIEKLNPSYFSKLFAKETGENVKSYILKAKLATARHMLADTEYELADIALSLGFSSQSAFTAAFRKEYNSTPGKYRNEASFGIISSHE